MKIIKMLVFSILVSGAMIHGADNVANASTNEHPSFLEQELPIKNGNFESGLDYWIVSNPGMNNPTLITENDNSYVRATSGENIHQYVVLQPSTTYTFTYEVAGSKKFPAKVELGTMNHGENFTVLKEETHDNEKWQQANFVFTTPDKNNNYIIRFGSTGDGWATFDSINAEPTHSNSLISVNVKSYTPYVNLNLSSDHLIKARLIVYVDGIYHMETYNGKNYYSYKSKVNNMVQVSRSFSGEKGQKIEVYEAPGSPGQPSKGKKLLETFILDKTLSTSSPELSNVVHSIKYDSNKLAIDIDKEIFAGDHRIKVKVNGSYISESYFNKIYYASISNRTDLIVQVSKRIDLKPGDIVSVDLESGLPGSPGKVLQILRTFEIE